MSEEKAEVEEGVLVAEEEEGDEEEVEYEEVEEEVEEETEDAADEEHQEKAEETPDVMHSAEAKVESTFKEETAMQSPPAKEHVEIPVKPQTIDEGAANATDLQHQLEQQAATIAAATLAAASKLNEQAQGLFSAAFGGGSSSEAPSLTKLAGGLTEGLASWWGSSNEVQVGSKANEMSLLVQSSSSKATSELTSLFGLSDDENLVETFKCKLIQTYACSHNSFTPAIQMAFQGTLYITDRHTCFSIEERNRKLPLKIPHSLIEKAVRQRPPRKGDLSDVLRLSLKATGSDSGQFIALKDFEGSNLDSALALIEHLMTECVKA